MELNIDETLRYLGYKSNNADDKILTLIKEVNTELQKAIIPKSIHKECTCSIIDNETVQLGSLFIKSKALSKHLSGCEKAVIFAATIGTAPDTLVKKYTITNLAKASIVQAAGAALIESFCDELQEKIRKQALKEGLFLTQRFSPGYGDLSLDYQPLIFDILECSKRIGIALTDTYLMLPTKSVTAIIGLKKDIGDKGHLSCGNKCSSCPNTECAYRRI